MGGLIPLGLIVLDRLSKWFILRNPDLYLGKFIELKLAKNYNFYFFSTNQFWLVIIMGAVILLFLLLLLRNPSTGLLLIVLGGLSNFFDRVFFGYVIDWIKISTSIFNIADIMIITGVICLISHSIKSK